MNDPVIPIWLIYFAGISESLSIFTNTFGLITTIIPLLITIFVGLLSELEINLFKNKIVVTILIIGILSMTLSYLIPPKRTIYTMMVASQLTPKNMKVIGGTMKETVDYLFDQTEELIKNVKTLNKKPVKTK